MRTIFLESFARRMRYYQGHCHRVTETGAGISFRLHQSIDGQLRLDVGYLFSSGFWSTAIFAHKNFTG